jgi:hypothetical protein
MGIFSKSASAILGPSGRVDELNRESATKTQRNTTIESASLAQFLKDRQLLPASDASAFDQGRERVEQSGLLRLMQETCGVINSMAGRTIVDAHTFLPPDPVISCFIFVDEGTEYLIRLELMGATPVLVFAERRWRDTVTNDFVRWAYRLAEIEPVTITIKLVHEFQDIRVTAEQVREWFKYLISRMERTYTPSF